MVAIALMHHVCKVAAVVLQQTSFATVALGGKAPSVRSTSMNVIPILVFMEESALMEEILICVIAEKLIIKDIIVRQKSPSVKLTILAKMKGNAWMNLATPHRDVKIRTKTIAAIAWLDILVVTVKSMQMSVNQIHAEMEANALI